MKGRRRGEEAERGDMQNIPACDFRSNLFKFIYRAKKAQLRPSESKGPTVAKKIDGFANGRDRCINIKNAGMRRLEDAVIEYHLLLSTLYELEERGESVRPLFRAGEPRWVGRVRECLAIPVWLQMLGSAWAVSTLMFWIALPYLSLERGIRRVQLWLA